MFRGQVRGCTTAKDDTISEVFTVEGRRMLAEHIPGQVCKRYGYPTFSRETTEQVCQLVHEDHQPVGTERLDVFAFA